MSTLSRVAVLISSHAGTVRDNITFGREVDQEWYNLVTDACALHPDLASFPNGDEVSACPCERRAFRVTSGVSSDRRW